MDALANFMKAIENYDLYDNANLVRYGVRVCTSYELYDFDGAVEAYESFSEELTTLDLHGTEDLTRPITEIYRSAVREVDS